MNRMPPNADNMQEVLRGPFDIKLHKLTFINYLEVVISPDGIVEYAVPSHLEKLLKIFMEQENISDRAVAIKTIEDRDTDMDGPLISLAKQTGYISVWCEAYTCGASPTKKQLATLRELKLNGLYHGTLNDMYAEKQKLIQAFRKVFEEVEKGAGNDTVADSN